MDRVSAPNNVDCFECECLGWTAKSSVQQAASFVKHEKRPVLWHACAAIIRLREKTRLDRNLATRYLGCSK
jgi:hypothetical protein